MKQETDGAEKCCTNTHSISKSNNKNKPSVKSRLSDTIEYFLLGLSDDSNKKSSVKMYLIELGALMAHFHCS